jgi:hypothetical protein
LALIKRRRSQLYSTRAETERERAYRTEDVLFQLLGRRLGLEGDLQQRMKSD